MFNVKEFEYQTKTCIENLIRKTLWFKKVGKSSDVEHQINETIDKLQKLFSEYCGLEFSLETPNEFIDLVVEEVENFAFNIFFAEKTKRNVAAYGPEINYVTKKIVNFAKRKTRKSAQDIFQEFIEKNLQFAEGEFTTKDDVYSAYLRFSVKRKSPELLSRVEFGKALKAAIPKIETGRKRIHGKATYGWRNLKLKVLC